MALPEGFLTLLVIFLSCQMMKSLPFNSTRLSLNHGITTTDHQIENLTSPTNSHETLSGKFSRSNSTVAKVTLTADEKTLKNHQVNITIRRSSLNYDEDDFPKLDENLSQNMDLDERDEFWSSKHQEPKIPADQFKDDFDHHMGVTPHSEDSHNDNFKFPDASGIGKVPACKHGTICEDIPNYPSELVSEAVKANSSLKFLEIFDELTEGRRSPDDADELCLSREHISRPRSALSKDNKWLYVLNDENFEQSIRVEICKVDDSPCQIIDSYPNQYKVTCKQKYIYRQMAALNPDGSVSSEVFRVPSSCCCHAKFMPNLSRSRFDQQKKNMTPANRKSAKLQ